MGIDFMIKSKTDPEWVESLGVNSNCKHAWEGIEWVAIFKFIGFHIIILYDNFPNYWSTDHIDNILNELKKIKSDPKKASLIYNYETCIIEFSEKNFQQLTKWIDQIDKLIKIFQSYVDHNCYIVVY